MKLLRGIKMAKKLTKHGNSLALIIEKPVLEAWGIDETTELNMIIVGDSLIIKPSETDIKAHKRRQDALIKTANDIMDKYESVFEKLAKI
jgi:antitoxin component of MazEF toxin-antitoxin module